MQKRNWNGKAINQSFFELVWLACWQQIKYTLWTRQNKIKLFDTKLKLRIAKPLNTVYNGIQIKQHPKVKYLGVF